MIMKSLVIFLIESFLSVELNYQNYIFLLFVNLIVASNYPNGRMVSLQGYLFFQHSFV